MMETADVLVGHLARVAGFDDDSIDDIRVSVGGSLANPITHGNRLDQAKRVTLEFVLLPDGLEVRTHDEGAGFDPASVPDPLATENLLQSGGRGILLMRSLMDEVRCSRSTSGGTLMVLVKRLPDSVLTRRMDVRGQDLANVGGAFFQSYPACGSFTGSAINLQAGAKTGFAMVSNGLPFFFGDMYLGYVPPIRLRPGRG